MTGDIEPLTGNAPAAGTAPSHDAHPLDAACANCGRLLYGRYCSHCGQSRGLYHRSIRHLIWEAFEGLLHLDGRLWRTLPALFFRSGALNKDLLQGRIARHVPPFRMFLIALVIFIFSAEQAAHHIQEGPHGLGKFTVDGQVIQGRAQAVARLRQNTAPRYALQVRQAEQRRDQAMNDPQAGASAQAAYEAALRAAAADRDARLQLAGAWAAFGNGNPRYERGIDAATERPEYYLTVLFEWVHRLAVLLLPLMAAFLGLAYVTNRKVYVYDHLLVSMTYLSFLLLLFAVVFILPQPLLTYAFLGALVWSPVNLFMALRGAYGSAVPWAAIKAATIFVATAASFLAMLVAVMRLAFYQL